MKRASQRGARSSKDTRELLLGLMARSERSEAQVRGLKRQLSLLMDGLRASNLIPEEKNDTAAAHLQHRMSVRFAGHHIKASTRNMHLRGSTDSRNGGLGSYAEEPQEGVVGAGAGAGVGSGSGAEPRIKVMRGPKL